MFKSAEANEHHKQYMAEVKAVMLKHAKTVPLDQQLALVSQFLGQLLAVQDQRIPVGLHMAVIGQNIEIGNAEAIATFLADQVLGGTQ